MGWLCCRFFGIFRCLSNLKESGRIEHVCARLWCWWRSRVPGLQSKQREMCLCGKGDHGRGRFLLSPSRTRSDGGVDVCVRQEPFLIWRPHLQRRHAASSCVEGRRAWIACCGSVERIVRVPGREGGVKVACPRHRACACVERLTTRSLLFFACERERERSAEEVRRTRLAPSFEARVSSITIRGFS